MVRLALDLRPPARTKVVVSVWTDNLCVEWQEINPSDIGADSGVICRFDFEQQTHINWIICEWIRHGLVIQRFQEECSWTVPGGESLILNLDIGYAWRC